MVKVDQVFAYAGTLAYCRREPVDEAWLFSIGDAVKLGLSNQVKAAEAASA